MILIDGVQRLYVGITITFKIPAEIDYGQGQFASVVEKQRDKEATYATVSVFKGVNGLELVMDNTGFNQYAVVGLEYVIKHVRDVTGHMNGFRRNIYGFVDGVARFFRNPDLNLAEFSNCPMVPDAVKQQMMQSFDEMW